MTLGLWGTTLKSIRLRDQHTIEMATLARMAFLEYFNLVTGLGTLQGWLEPLQADVFAVDAETGRFRILTETPDIDESPVLYWRARHILSS